MKKYLPILLVFVLISVVYASNVIIVSFNAGILSPMLSGRIDFAKYTSGMQQCQNAIPLPQGGVTRRPGTEYLGTTYGNAEGRLIPFIFSEDQAYILEFTDLLMRVWADGGIVQTVDASTQLLLHFDDYDGSTSFTDSGTNTITVGSTGTAQHDTAQLKFGVSTLYTDGNGDTVTITDGNGFNDYWYMATNAFTVDFWIRLSDVSQTTAIWNQTDDASNAVSLSWDASGGAFVFQIYDSAVLTVDLAAVYAAGANTWYHVAVIRGWGGVANSWAITINGTQVNTLTDADEWPDLAAVLSIGTSGNVPGWIDEFRVSTTARWTTNFAVPTFPYPTGDETGTNYTLASPYSTGDLSRLRYVQSADTMYLIHPDYMPRKLTRTAHDAWSFTAFDWDSASLSGGTGIPPWRQNLSAVTLSPDATSGTVTVTANVNFFYAGHIGAYFKQSNGIYKITDYTSATSVTATVVDALDASTATTVWFESVWSDYRGYPSAVAFFENRLVFANSRTYPQTIWMSETDDYEDFVVNDTVTDADAITVTVADERVNAIKWLLSSRRLLFGTTGGEWWLTGNATEEAVTPTSVLVRKSTPYGSGDVLPVVVGNDALFVNKPGKKIRRFVYEFSSDSYQATDLSILAETLMDGKEIKEIVFQQNPYQIIWCRLDDGTLASLSYIPEHDVYAWATHELARYPYAEVESIATIPGDTDDEVWMIVNRIINSARYRYVERLHNFYFDSIENAVYSDASATYDSTEALTITGLDHLESEAVAVLADGEIVTGKSISSGNLTLDASASVVQVGLPYSTIIETMRLGLGSPVQTTQGLIKKINKITARLYKSMSATIGPDASNQETLIEAYTAGDNDTEIRIPQGRSTDGVVYIVNDQPTPLTVLALIYDVDIYP